VILSAPAYGQVGMWFKFCIVYYFNLTLKPFPGKFSLMIEYLTAEPTEFFAERTEEYTKIAFFNSDLCGLTKVINGKML
jgi:hypothetical protein